MRSWVIQLRKGFVELVVLAALEQGEAYGYELLQRINNTDGLGMTESTVYPLLARLTREKHLTGRAEPSTSGPPRRYYKLTASGKRRLREMKAHWKEIQAGVDEIINGANS